MNNIEVEFEVLRINAFCRLLQRQTRRTKHYIGGFILSHGNGLSGRPYIFCPGSKETYYEVCNGGDGWEVSATLSLRCAAALYEAETRCGFILVLPFVA